MGYHRMSARIEGEWYKLPLDSGTRNLTPYSLPAMVMCLWALVRFISTTWINCCAIRLLRVGR